MIVWAPAVLSVLYARVLYFCLCPCSAQLSMFHRESSSRNTLIIVIMMMMMMMMMIIVAIIINCGMHLRFR